MEEASVHREFAGKTVYFCCEKCATYFSEHAERVAEARSLSPPR